MEGQSTISEERRSYSAGQPEHPLIPAGRVSGADVYGAEGEKIGHVEDVALEKVDGNVAYAILSLGGFLGLGARYHPVPWSMLRYDIERRGYVIPCTKDQLETAPTIDREELSGWDDAALRDGLYAYYAPYGAQPYWMP